jgi:death-on-curing protein
MIPIELAYEIHEIAINKYGGLSGTRDEGLLISALQQPFKGIGDEDFYPGFLTKASVLVFGIVKNHPFFDGNKRTGLALMLYYLISSGYTINASDDELFDFVQKIASGDLNLNEIEIFLARHCE